MTYNLIILVDPSALEALAKDSLIGLIDVFYAGPVILNFSSINIPH